jgi:hypothetical protein
MPVVAPSLFAQHFTAFHSVAAGERTSWPLNEQLAAHSRREIAAHALGILLAA